VIRSSVTGTGVGDPITIVVGRLEIDGAAIETTTPRGPGIGADLTIDARDVSLTRYGLIRTNGQGRGEAGDVTVRATNSITVHGASNDEDGAPQSAFRSAIESLSDKGEGLASSLTVEAPEIFVLHGGMLRTRTDITGGHAGDLTVTAGRLVVAQDAEVSSVTLSRIGEDAGNLDITAGSIDVQGSDVLGRVFLARPQPTGIFSRSQRSESGDAGNVQIEAGDLSVREGALISTVTLSPGSGGDLSIDVDRLRVLSGSAIDSSTGVQGTAGDLTIRASQSVEISGQGPSATPSRVGSLTLIAGDAGDVRIDTPLLTVDGGLIATTSVGFGNLVADANSIEDPTARNLFLARFPEEDYPGGRVSIREFAEVLTGGALPPEGNAGVIELEVSDLRVVGGGRIDSSSLSEGAAGAVLITATGSVEVAGPGSEIASRPGAGGAGGGIEITAPEISVSDDGRISVSARAEPIDAQRFLAGGVIVLIDTLALGLSGSLGDIFEPAVLALLADLGISPFDAALLSDLLAHRTLPENPDAGSVSIHADRLRVAGGTIEAAAEDASGGNVTLVASETIEIDHAVIDASVDNGNGGRIDIQAEERIQLDRGTITASVTNGDGGNLMIDPDFVILGNGSRIIAQAVNGAGGNIEVVADTYIAEPDTVVDASAEFGVDGTVVIRSPDVDVAGKVASLPSSYLDAAGLLGEPCAARHAEGRGGSFVLAGRTGVAAGPDAHLVAAAPLDGPAPTPLGTAPAPQPALARTACR
jgi:hypothetical protein